MNNRDQPHNNFFINQFSNIEFAYSYFQEYLPATLVSLIDWSTLGLVPGDFVQKALLNCKSDILYEVKLSGRKAFLFPHLEHQRTCDLEMPFRVFIYEGNIWQQFRKQHPDEPIPLIYPMVLYQGKKEWSAPLSFHDYLNVPNEIKDYIPDFRYDLLDLSHLRDEEIQGILIVKVALLIMKHIDSPNLDYLFDILLPLMNELFQSKTGLEYIESVLYYLSKAKPNLNKAAVIEEFQKYPQFTGIKEVFMTLYEEALQEGFEKGEKTGFEKGEKTGFEKGEKTGFEKGRQEEKREIALRLLKNGVVTLAQASQGTGFSVSELKQMLEKGIDDGKSDGA